MAVTSLESCETTLHGGVAPAADTPTTALGGCPQMGARLLEGRPVNTIQYGSEPIPEHVNRFIDAWRQN